MKIEYSNMWAGFEPPKVIFNELLKSFENTDKQFNISAVFGSVAKALKPGKINIHLAGEPHYLNDKRFDIILCSDFSNNNIISFPFFLHWLYWDEKNLVDKLYITPSLTKQQIPKKFCCFLVSNPKCQTRNNFFKLLDSIKKVDSCGKHLNNCGFIMPHGHSTQQFRDFISQYKFIIAFENTKTGTYITEKLINPLLANIIPIWWGTDYVTEIFNEKAFIRYNENNPLETISKILEIDADDNKYLQMVNQPRFIDIDKFKQEYSLESMAKKIADRLR
jgi:hypothetical protein